MKDFDKRMAEAREALAGGEATTLAYLLDCSIDELLDVGYQHDPNELRRYSEERG